MMVVIARLAFTEITQAMIRSRAAHPVVTAQAAAQGDGHLAGELVFKRGEGAVHAGSFSAGMS